MAENPFSAEKKEASEDWLLSYADMITLLLAFFVMLLSMAKIDPVKYEKVENSMAQTVGKHDVEQPLAQIKNELQGAIKSENLDPGKVDLGNDDQGLVLDLDGDTFFAAGSAAIQPQFVPTLGKLFDTIAQARFSAFQIEVEGHTDDTPFGNAVYPSNWELSTARASIIVRFLIQRGIAPDRLSATGYADTRPKVPNKDMDGHPLPANQAINRRVSIRIHPR